MANYKSKKEETKKNNRIDVKCEQPIDNDLIITKISFYHINKNGIKAKAQVVINDILVLDNIIITEKDFVNLPSQVWEKDGEKNYSNHYFFIKKGIPKDFSDYILAEYKANL